jgi:hypothetical protein
MNRETSEGRYLKKLERETELGEGDKTEETRVGVADGVDVASSLCRAF